MEETENIYDKIKEFLSSNPASINILEEQIDIDVQMKYFDCSRKYKKDINTTEVFNSVTDLFHDDTEIEKKKKILAKLASIEEVKAYRYIESYIEERPDELKDWALLALQESKMLLESKILDENQVFISTGLGGKGHKLRYFVIIIGNQIEKFSNLQKKIIRQEFEISVKKNDGEVEDINFSGDLATVMAVIPLKRAVKAVFEEAIEECNTYGNFISIDFVITNVKKLSFEEINDFLKENNIRKP